MGDKAPFFYRHGTGTIHAIRRFDALIRPHTGGIVTTRGGNATRLLLKELQPGMPVHFAWLNRDGSFDFPREVDGSAVEPAGYWRRASAYQPLHAENQTQGKLAEELFIKLVSQAGIRIEHATPFEDEWLGIDAWMFTSLGPEFWGEYGLTRRWDWLPLDFTFQRLDFTGEDPESKAEKVLGRHVVPIHLHHHLPGTPEGLAAHLVRELIACFRKREGCHETLVTRQEAMDKEISWKPKRGYWQIRKRIRAERQAARIQAASSSS